MANLLVIESWVRSVGLILPEKLRALDHRYTFVSRKPEHYSNWARGAGLIGASEHPLIALAESVVVADTNDIDALLAVLRPLQRERRFDGVLTTCDYYLDIAARVAEALGLPGAPPSALQVTREKHLMREACRRAGLPGPQFLATARLDDALAFAASIGFPVVVKAVDLCGSELVVAAHNQDELCRAFTRISAEPTNIRGQARQPVVLVEEMLRGEEFSVETCTFRGETTVLGVTDKCLAFYPHFIEAGLMHPADIPEAQASQLSEFVRQALTAVGYSHGLAHTEVKLTPDGPRIIEINARMGGSYIFELVELVTGVNLFAAAIDLALDRPPAVALGQTGVASAAVRFLLAPGSGTIAAVEGADGLRALPDIHRVAIDDVIGKSVRTPEDNNDYLGHVIALDRHGRGARKRAEWACEQLAIRMA